MLFEPQSTPFDLNFRIFGADVRVHPWFWLLSAFLGWNLVRGEHGLLLLVIWIACVFVSILLHELGHIFMGRIFGSDGYIVLYSFGGLAVGINLQKRWQRIAVSFAGPGIQLILFGLLILFLVYGFKWVQPGTPRFVVGNALTMLLEINLFWALLNLLPIWPLDGGKINREIFNWVMPAQGTRASLGISLTAAGFLAINELAARAHHPLLPINAGGDLWIALFFAMFAFSNFQELQTIDRFRRDDDRWPRDPDSWGQ